MFLELVQSLTRNKSVRVFQCYTAVMNGILRNMGSLYKEKKVNRKDDFSWHQKRSVEWGTAKLIKEQQCLPC